MREGGRKEARKDGEKESRRRRRRGEKKKEGAVKFASLNWPNSPA